MTAEEVYESVTSGGASDFAVAVEIFGRFGAWCCSIPVAALADVVQRKIWAWEDPERRLTKRKKDELDLLRLAEANPALRPILPQEIACQLESEREEK